MNVFKVIVALIVNGFSKTLKGIQCSLIHLAFVFNLLTKQMRYLTEHHASSHTVYKRQCPKLILPTFLVS